MAGCRIRETHASRSGIAQSIACRQLVTTETVWSLSAENFTMSMRNTQSQLNLCQPAEKRVISQGSGSVSVLVISLKWNCLIDHVQSGTANKKSAGRFTQHFGYLIALSEIRERSLLQQAEPVPCGDAGKPDPEPLGSSGPVWQAQAQR